MQEPSLLSAASKRPMPFWQMFLRVLPANFPTALEAAYWHLTGRRVRARNRLAQVAALLPGAYTIWMRQAEAADGLADLAAGRLSAWSRHPRFLAILQDSDAASSATQATIRSLRKQLYPEWKLLVPFSLDRLKAEFGADAPLASYDPTDLQAAAVLADDYDYLLALRSGEILAETALLRMAEAGQGAEPPLVIFGDHDELDSHGRRRNPWFKADWNEEMFLALDYLSPTVAIHRQLVAPILSKPVPHGLFDREGLITKAARGAEGRIAHIPHILAHTPLGEMPPRGSSRLATIQRELRPDGADAQEGAFDTIKVRWPLPETLPLVSIIIPTRDKLELLRPCVETLVDRTTYSPFEVLVVDNRSSDPAVLEYLKRLALRPQVRVLKYDEDYNFSAINNFAARNAAGKYLCLLNNDTEIVDGEWLTEMMRQAIRPGIGAVGSKLLYPDGKIQHAGVVVGLGGAAGHAHRFEPDDEPGYFRQAHVAQFVSAVTAACLVVSKANYFAVGGLDEPGFAVAFNDVDFCLKLEREGLRNVYTPHAVLIHHESKSRGKDHAPANIARFTKEHALLQERWKTETYRDPGHSPNLDRRSERFIIDL